MSQGIQIVKDTDNKRYQLLKIPYTECLKFMGRLLGRQHSKRFFVVVYVRDSLGGPDAPRNTDSKTYRK